MLPLRLYASLWPEKLGQVFWYVHFAAITDQIAEQPLECALTCHQTCSHLVPDFCGMTMEMANILLKNLRDIKTTQVHKKPTPSVTSSTTSSVSTLPVYQQQTPERPQPIQQQQSLPQVPQRSPHGTLGIPDAQNGRFSTPAPAQSAPQTYPAQADPGGPRTSGSSTVPYTPHHPKHRLSYQESRSKDGLAVRIVNMEKVIADRSRNRLLFCHRNCLRLLLP